MTDHTASNPSPQQLAARWLSRLFHPFIIAPLTLFLILYLATGSLAVTLKWGGLSILVVVLPLTLLILWMVQNGRFSDFDVSVREQRHALYLVAVGCALLLMLLFRWGQAPAIAQGSLYAAIAATTLAGLINRITKVSLHAATIAGCATALLRLNLPLGILLTLIALFVSWSRVQLQQHTSKQIVLGWLIAVPIVWLILSFIIEEVLKKSI